jgi:hypothetical protein
VTGDFANGAGPWSLDVVIRPIASNGTLGDFYNPVGGDVSIIDFPLQDGEQTFDTPVPAAGEWQFVFSSTDGRSNWTYGLRDVTYYLLAEVPSRTFQTTATPDAKQLWSRPFFIGGISTLGPVAYDALEFTVSESGVYAFESVRPDGDDHFAFLYRGQFDAESPLQNLLDYGLGNGFSPFDIPRGTSAFSALLLEGEPYVWVTSQWDRFSPIAATDNTVIGPGEIIVGTPGCSAADVAPEFGVLNTNDVIDFVTAYNAGDSTADVSPFPTGDGLLNVNDVIDFVTAFNAGCP